MKAIKIVTFAALAAVSVSSFAAKPRSIEFSASHEAADGSSYATYTVKCSDGTENTLTSYSRSKWCVGDNSAELCEKKQIKAAQKACKA
ncbi:hypothetical protein E4634_09110 [Mangrovimicrobium sediminis]|uniref:Uncharacterized protein n=1 Tax=Mangrovimicrobium sediminis TaxID=2562682 RepID=A0A4Z0M495_9GAMM|nr:hypothetical protein [Haliea sp. SAOS-164]TGD74270.1 hypothetical protein E4634_09110 [Haliea sp. SAOS-164]